MTAEIVLLHPERAMARAMEDEKPLADWLVPMIARARLVRALAPDYHPIRWGMFGSAA